MDIDTKLHIRKQRDDAVVKTATEYQETKAAILSEPDAHSSSKLTEDWVTYRSKIRETKNWYRTRKGK